MTSLSLTVLLLFLNSCTAKLTGMVSGRKIVVEQEKSSFDKEHHLDPMVSLVVTGEVGEIVIVENSFDSEVTVTVREIVPRTNESISLSIEVQHDKQFISTSNQSIEICFKIDQNKPLTDVTVSLESGSSVTEPEVFEVSQIDFSRPEFVCIKTKRVNIIAILRYNIIPAVATIKLPPTSTPTPIPAVSKITVKEVFNDYFVMEIIGDQLSDHFLLSSPQTKPGVADCKSGKVIPKTSSSAIVIANLQGATTYEVKVCAVAKNGATSTGTTVSVETAIAGVVQPIYSNAKNWSDYIRNDGVTSFSATNIGCDGNDGAGKYFSEQCIHGGEKLVMSLIDTKRTCLDFVVKDQLEAFDWNCEKTGTTLNFRSLGLKEDSRLSDLLGELEFLDNRLLIYESDRLVASSSASKWWSNPVLALPVGNPLSQSGAVYQLKADRTDLSHEITADHISIVVSRSATLKGGGKTVFGSNRKFLWIEGNFSQEIKAGYTFDFDAVSSSVFRHVTIVNVYGAIKLANSTTIEMNFLKISAAAVGAFDSVLLIDLSDYMQFKNVNLSNNVGSISFSSTSNIRLKKVYHSGSSGEFRFFGSQLIWIDQMTSLHPPSWLTITTCYNCVFSNWSVSNLKVYGSDSVYLNLLVTNTGQLYLSNFDVTRNTFLNTTIANTTGMYMYRGADNVFVNTAFVNNSSYSLLAQHSDHTNNFFSQTYADSPFVFESGMHEDVFVDNFLNGNLSCTYNAPGINPGLDTSCENNGASTAIHTNVGSLATTFVGKVSDDSINASDVAGQSAYADINDWFAFENRYRKWGKNGLVFPDISNTGTCLTGDQCQIWDWRLRATDTILRGTTGDGSTQNAPFIKNVACPTAVNGNKTITDFATVSNTFLINAQEILFDQIGDDDGRCESAESCIYSPNFGAYQGEGDYLGNESCLFTDGTVSGVTMYAYPVNGI